MKNRKGNMARAAGNVARALVIAVVALAANLASAQQTADLKFKGAIGVIPVTGVQTNGAINLNVVRNVAPGSPWRIEDLSAQLSSDGRIIIEGRGLLLATGNGIGTNANQSVHATLFCGPAAGATAHNTTLSGVALEANGDFKIDDTLSPPPPPVCESPVLLIRNVGGVWFAAGIQKFDTDNGKEK